MLEFCVGHLKQILELAKVVKLRGHFMFERFEMPEFFNRPSPPPPTFLFKQNLSPPQNKTNKCLPPKKKKKKLPWLSKGPGCCLELSKYMAVGQNLRYFWGMITPLR